MIPGFQCFRHISIWPPTSSPSSGPSFGLLSASSTATQLGKDWDHELWRQEPEG